MSRHVLDEKEVRKLPPKERLENCSLILKNSNDESLRWDAVWLAGEIAEDSGPDDPIFDQVADLMVWVLENDNNGVVKHEASFQIAARNMRKKIPDLVKSVQSDKSGLVKHESLESLGLMRAFEVEEMIAKAVSDPNHDVSQTAAFVLKRFARLKNLKEKYTPSRIL
ncbi:MAG TPA: HEAT repeat domain-containing protein [Nitrosopumilaceae archaeon]|nr:HEAT repeat domain-containing protein [Nitrosopumilaceae archaeon]